jgi:hypothetical protein
VRTPIKILGIFLTFILFGCRKPIKEFQIDTNNKKEIVKFYSDSTFTLESDKNDYSGNWNGRLKEGDTVSISSTMNGYNVLTSTPKESFEIINGQLTRLKKNGFQKGWKLSELINFAMIENIKIRNVDGPHYLTKKQWNEIKSDIINSRSIGGLMCKPQWLVLIFEFKDGKSIEGSICGNLINFEDEISGSFRIEREINLHNY